MHGLVRGVAIALIWAKLVRALSKTYLLLLGEAVMFELRLLTCSVKIAEPKHALMQLTF